MVRSLTVSQFLSTCALLSVVMSTYQSMFPYGRTEVYLLALAHAIAVALDIAAFVVLVFDLAKAVKGRKAKRMVRYTLVRKCTVHGGNHFACFIDGMITF